MKSKKGAEMSLNIIIVAAIALIVLVVLVMIFTGRMNIFGTGVQKATENKCSDQQGIPRLATEGCGEDRQVYGAFTDLAANQICCVPL
jgi:hypothetical protein